MMSLYRIVEPSGGTITVDGVDVSQIGLADLRSRLALVPQVGSRERNVILALAEHAPRQSRFVTAARAGRSVARLHTGSDAVL